MASQFQEEFVGEKSNHMVTVTPIMGKLKVHIRQFYANEKKRNLVRMVITLELEEFDKLVN